MAFNMHVLIIGSVWPEPDSSAAGRRMMQLIELFQTAGWTITFASSSRESAHAVNLADYGIDIVSININDSAVDSFLQKLNPDVVLFDRFVIEEQFGWRVAEQCPDTLRILDTEDLHCLRRARKKAIEEKRFFDNNDLLTAPSAKREIASIYRCDYSLIISEYEIDLLTGLFDIDESLLHYLPFLLDPIGESAFKVKSGFEDRADFMTIGNFRHAPNWDSVKYIRDEIWPLIREQLPDAQMHVYGAYPSQQAMGLHQPADGFLIKGRAQSSREVMQRARVCLAPLRYGAGLKGKLVEAMQCGTPSITTAIGAEGIAGNMDWSGVIAEEPKDLATAAVDLYSDNSQWKKAQQQGWKIINQRFDKYIHSRPFLDKLAKRQDRIHDHRAKNFTGQMLMHHTAASTKYMARWIEEKNKK